MLLRAILIMKMSECVNCSYAFTQEVRTRYHIHVFGIYCEVCKDCSVTDSPTKDLVTIFRSLKTGV